MYSWLSRGLATTKDVAEWKFDGDEGKVADVMKRTPNIMQKLLALDQLPAVGDSDQNKQLLKQAETSILPGESTSHWCVLDSESASSSNVQPIPLPSWFKIPLDKTIAIWKREKDEWDAKRKKRLDTKGTQELTKDAEEKYQARGLSLI